MNRDHLYSYIKENQPNICGMSVLKDGKTIFSEDFNGYSKESTNHIMSVTKSIVSILIGIAIDKGLIKSVDDCVIGYFPDYKIKRGEKTIQSVKIKHLLTMTAPYKYKSEPWTKVCIQNDWTLAALDLLGGRAGITGEFKYSTLGIHILNGIITKTSGQTTVDFAYENLFEPLGIAKKEIYTAPDAAAHKDFIMNRSPKGNIWFTDPVGVSTAGYGLCLSSEEMVKIGLMCQNGGEYNGKRIVSKEWLCESTKTHVHCDGAFRIRNMKYGYLFWIIDEEKHIYSAIGNSGNVIYVDNTNNIVVSVSAYFKPTVYNRIDFIQNTVIPEIIG